MTPLLVLALTGPGFLLSHLALSHPPLRQPLVRRLGEGGFLGLYSLVSLVFFVPLVATWYGNIHTGALLWIFRGPAATHPLMGAALLGFGLVGMGVLSPSPTSMTGPRELAPTGATAITRHPVNMGLAIWSATHMLLNGWVGDLLFFGSLFAVSVLGSLHQDYRNSIEREGYADFLAETTWLPVPTPSRLARVGLRGWAGFVLGVIIAFGLYHGHGALFR